MQLQLRRRTLQGAVRTVLQTYRGRLLGTRQSALDRRQHMLQVRKLWIAFCSKRIYFQFLHSIYQSARLTMVYING